MEISVESGVGKLNNFACPIIWFMLSPFHQASYRLPISSSLSHIYNSTTGVK